MSASVSWADKPVSLQVWTLGEFKDAQINRLHQNKVDTVLVEQGKSKVSFVAKDAPAQSINTIKKRMKEVSADPSTLKTYKANDGSMIFAFNTGVQAYWYSTKGGLLLLNTDKSSPADLNTFSSGVNRK